MVMVELDDMMMDDDEPVVVGVGVGVGVGGVVGSGEHLSDGRGNGSILGASVVASVMSPLRAKFEVCPISYVFFDSTIQHLFL